MHDSLILSRSLRALGETTLGVERGTRSGVFVRVRPGAYVASRDWAGMDGATRHRVAMDALRATSRRPPVFAEESAALALGIPIVGPWPELPRVISAASSRRPRVAIVPRWRPIASRDVVVVDGVWATSPEVTALDLAARRDLESGVAAIDHVVRDEGVTLESLARRLDVERPFRGAPKVEAALRYANGRAESVLESVSLLRMLQLGFERPRQQAEFVIGADRFRADFYWPRLQLIGEADGRAKYGDFSGDELWQEKLREDALRGVVRGFVRWTWRDAWDGAPLAAKLRAAGVREHPRKASQRGFIS